MADDDAKARRTTKATGGGPARKGAKRATGAVDPVKKASVKKAAVKKASVKKAAVKKAAVKKAAVKKAAPAPRAAASKAAPKKAATVRKAPAKRSGGRDAGAVLAPRKKAPPPLRLAAEQTFDDDAWREPDPEPVREDPAARVRGILRAAALRVEAKESGTAPVTPPAAPPPVPPRPDHQVTRVLVSPPPADPDFEVDDDLTEPVPVVDEDEEDDWAPPEVLDDLSPASSPAPSTAPSSPPPSPPPPPASDPPHPEATQVIVPPAPAPAPENKKSRLGLRLLLVLLVLAVAAGAVFAFLTFRDDGIDYSELKVGDCFDSTESDEVRGIDVKPCSEPHNSEIFFLVQHPAGPDEPYPGRDALVQFAADACLGQPLTDYLGVPLEQSSLKDFEIVPQQSAWEDGRRVLVCGLDTGGGEDITGSVKGTRR